MTSDTDNMPASTSFGGPAGGIDLSEDEAYGSRETQLANAALDEAAARLRFRRIAVLCLLSALLLLGLSLAAFVCSFLTHTEAISEHFRKPEPALNTVSARVLSIAAEAASSASEAAAPTVAGGKKGLAETVKVLTVDLASMAQSMVAIISVLVVAIVILTLGLVRATFSMTISAEERRGAPEKPSQPDVPLFAVELLKEIRSILADLVRAKGN